MHQNHSTLVTETACTCYLSPQHRSAFRGCAATPRKAQVSDERYQSTVSETAPEASSVSSAPMRPNAGAGPACKYADTTPLSACNLSPGGNKCKFAGRDDACRRSGFMAHVIGTERSRGTMLEGQTSV